MFYELKSRDEADSVCTNDGGYLAQIDSPGKQYSIDAYQGICYMRYSGTKVIFFVFRRVLKDRDSCVKFVMHLTLFDLHVDPLFFCTKLSLYPHVYVYFTKFGCTYQDDT